MTVDECRRMLFRLAIKHGIAPRLISERLLSKEDKNDMLDGHVSFLTLDCTVAVWKEQGMLNYADGSAMPYEHHRALLAKCEWEGGGKFDHGYNRKFAP